MTATKSNSKSKTHVPVTVYDHPVVSVPTKAKAEVIQQLVNVELDVLRWMVDMIDWSDADWSQFVMEEMDDGTFDPYLDAMADAIAARRAASKVRQRKRKKVTPVAAPVQEEPEAVVTGGMQEVKVKSFSNPTLPNMVAAFRASHDTSLMEPAAARRTKAMLANAKIQRLRKSAPKLLSRGEVVLVLSKPYKGHVKVWNYVTDLDTTVCKDGIMTISTQYLEDVK